MRPITDSVDTRAVAQLRAAVPELEDRYLELLDIHEDALGADVVFTELADLVTGLLQRPDEAADLLDRCFDAVESLAESADADTVEIVGYSFLDNLPPEALGRATAWLGPCTLDVLDRLESGDLGDPEVVP